MKSKKNRKSIRDPSPGGTSHAAPTSELIKFKFNLSDDNISCFMNKNRVSKRICRKTSQSSAKSQKPQSKPKSVVTGKDNISETTQDSKCKK